MEFDQNGSEMNASPVPSLGEVNYAGYVASSGGKSLVSGADLPSWADQDPRIQQAWSAGAMAVVDAWRAAGEPADVLERYALVEMLGYRRVVGVVREAELCGRPMLEVRPLTNDAVQLVGPDSLYALTWMTRDQAERETRTGAHAPAAIGRGGDPWAGTGYATGAVVDELDECDGQGDEPGADERDAELAAAADELAAERDYDAEGNEL